MQHTVHQRGTPVHIIVFQHGIWGTALDLKLLETKLKDRFSNNIEILNFSGNKNYRTYDGIDVCGRRLGEAVLNRLSAAVDPPVDRLSFIGYSLGGLIVRYAIGFLEAKQVFTEVKALNFISVACPHAGASRRPHNLWNRIYNAMSSFLLSRSGSQMNLNDNDGYDEGPLLQMMADPEFPFWRGLQRFSTRKAFANTIKDRVVSFTTSAMESSNAYNKADASWIIADPKYPSIVTLAGSMNQEAGKRALKDMVDGDVLMQDVQEDVELETVESAALGSTTVMAIGAATIVTAPPRTRSMLFYVLLPIFLPLALIVLISMYVQARARHLLNEGFTRYLETSWVVQGGDTDMDRSDDRVNSLRQNIIAQLNALQWTKVHVRIDHGRSHAAIIGRKNSPLFIDVLDYLVDHFEI